MERKAPPWRPTELRRGRVRGFSDSFSRHFVNKGIKKGRSVDAPAPLMRLVEPPLLVIQEGVA